jgi:hypothetical protein
MMISAACASAPSKPPGGPAPTANSAASDNAPNHSPASPSGQAAPRDNPSDPRADTLSVPAAPGQLGASLVGAGLWRDIVGVDPARGSVELAPEVVTRVSVFDIAAFANRLSARAGLAPCYRLECDVGPEYGGGVASGERVAWLLRERAGCPRADQPWCIDANACRVELTGDDACGYRLPTLSEWSQQQSISGPGAGAVAEWVWPDQAMHLDARTSAFVAGRTALSTATVPADRVVPAVAAMKAMHIGFRLARGPVRPAAL